MKTAALKLPQVMAECIYRNMQKPSMSSWKRDMPSSNICVLSTVINTKYYKTS